MENNKTLEEILREMDRIIEEHSCPSVIQTRQKTEEIRRRREAENRYAQERRERRDQLNRVTKMPSYVRSQIRSIV